MTDGDMLIAGALVNSHQATIATALRASALVGRDTQGVAYGVGTGSVPVVFAEPCSSRASGAVPPPFAFA